MAGFQPYPLRMASRRRELAAAAATGAILFAAGGAIAYASRPDLAPMPERSAHYSTRITGWSELYGALTDAGLPAGEARKAAGLAANRLGNDGDTVDLGVDLGGTAEAKVLLRMDAKLADGTSLVVARAPDGSLRAE